MPKKTVKCYFVELEDSGGVAVEGADLEVSSNETVEHDGKLYWLPPYFEEGDILLYLKDVAIPANEMIKDYLERNTSPVKGEK